MSAVPARVAWAVELLDPGPAEHVLEVGCGPGVAAELIGARLTTGRMLAVDRSAVAVRRTAARVAGMPVDVRQCALADLNHDGEFDAALTINLNAFWTRPDGPDLAVLARALRPGGRMLVLYGADGPTTAGRVTGPITAGMAALGLAGVHMVNGAHGLGVVARRPT